MTRTPEWCAPLAAALLLLFTYPAAGQEREFQARILRNGRAGALPYRLYVPPRYDQRQKYPLVLWLHGGGGRGSDNLAQLREGNAVGALIWARAAHQSRYPAFVVAPQCPRDEMWTSLGENVRASDRLRDVVALIRELQTTYSIDAARLYVAGQSMGGYGAWALVSEYPDMFAAAVPICGGGDASAAPKLVDVPVWAFHGALDRAVDVERSRGMIAAIRRAGGKPRYTEYSREGHVVWHRAFAEPQLLPWMFAQRRRPVPRPRG